MIIALHHKLLVPVLVMLLAVAGLSLSAIGEASSHGLVEMTGSSGDDHDHSHHDHDHDSDVGGQHPHHDAGNHSHESLEHPVLVTLLGSKATLRHYSPVAGESPRTFRYRLERPPKHA